MFISGNANYIYNALKQAVTNGSAFHVYKNSEIPDHWHFKNNRRAPPIFAIAEPPHVFHDFYAYTESLEKQWNFTCKILFPSNLKKTQFYHKTNNFL